MDKILRLLVTLAIASTSACAHGLSDSTIAKSQKRLDHVIAALVQKFDADSLAAAGLMSFGRHGDQSLPLLARAIDAAPDRPDIVWLQVQRCSQSPPCDPAPFERRLRELDPTNGAGWWGTLARASAANDVAGTDAALTAISQSGRLDIYWTALVARLGRAVANTHRMSLAESEVAVMGIVAAAAIPAYQTITTSCKGERLQQAGMTEVCRGVASAMQRGDTYITEMIGVAIAERVWPEDSAEWKAAAEERRVYSYQSELSPKLEWRAITHPGEFLTLCAQNRREQDVLAARLTAAGYEPNPPSPSGRAVPTATLHRT